MEDLVKSICIALLSQMLLNNNEMITDIADYRLLQFMDLVALTKAAERMLATEALAADRASQTDTIWAIEVKTEWHNSTIGRSEECSIADMNKDLVH